jgi:hypothetical protein
MTVVRVRTSAGWQDLTLAGPPGTPSDATPSAKGIIKLAGDLAGSADLPAIASGVIVDADVNAAAAIKGSKLNFNIGSSPPGSPSTGDLWIYNGTAGIYWMFIYDNSEATNKWKFVGGPPLRAGRATDETFTEGASYVNAGTALAVTLPRAGDYYFEHFCNIFVSGQTAAANAAAKITISNGSLEINDSSILQGYCASGSAVGGMAHGVNTGATASATLTQQYLMPSAAGGTAHVRWRNIAVWPIRVI